MDLRAEIKRKLFHHLALIYLLIYWVCPRMIAIVLMGIATLTVGAVEFIRLRRPEMNAWFLQKFGGIHRESEIMRTSGIFWTLLGCWATMVIFTNARIVLPALGFLVFGDTAAALVGKKWGKTPWEHDPKKSKEGSAGFVVASLVWSIFFLKWPVAFVGSVFGAWVESRKWRFNDNFMIPLLSGGALSILNLVIGR